MRNLPKIPPGRSRWGYRVRGFKGGPGVFGLLTLSMLWALPVLWMHASAARAADDDGDDDDDELSQVVVTATRRPVLVKDEPLHVEAVPAEEIEENLTEAPGNISMIFSELPGVHVESAAPGLGGASVQLRGMPGHDTLILMDGLPILGAEPDAFGFMQTPPLDLSQAEVIKGAVSALYGGSALGGVLNLVSRTPHTGSSFLLSGDSHGGRQAEAFVALPGTQWSSTLTAGADTQSREDIDNDGWADLAYHQRLFVRPRLWWQQGKDQSLFLTAGFMDEDREGGTQPGAMLGNGQVFPEDLHTRRFDIGAVSHFALDEGALDGRYSLTSNQETSTFGALHANPTLTTAYLEEAWSGEFHDHKLIAGLAFEHDGLNASQVPGVGYEYNVPAAFVQDEFAPWSWLTIAASARVDAQNDYGTYVSPNLSALLHAQGAWSLRAAVADGFTAPTPQLEDIQSTSLATLLPLHNLHAERARTASLDARWADEGWDVNVSAYTSEIRDPLEVIAVGERFELVNDPGIRRAPGTEVVVMYRLGPLESIASWNRVYATQTAATGIPSAVPLVPHSTAQIGTILESEKRGRVGLEVEYTGPQDLEDDPWRASSPGFIEFNALAEVRFGRLRLFFNALNLSNVRQSNWTPLLRPSPGPGGNPITEDWAPLTGRTFNAGLRIDL